MKALIVVILALVFVIWIASHSLSVSGSLRFFGLAFGYNVFNGTVHAQVWSAGDTKTKLLKIERLNPMGSSGVNLKRTSAFKTFIGTLRYFYWYREGASDWILTLPIPIWVIALTFLALTVIHGNRTEQGGAGQPVKRSELVDIPDQNP